jgi:hypothetical protein
MPGKLLFEVPVYRTSHDDYIKELQAAKAAYMDRVAEGWAYYERPGTDPRLKEDHFKRMEYAFHDSWRSWHYNQAIGWIQLLGRWDVIKGEYHFAREKKIVQHPRHRSFEWRGKTLELWLPHKASSREIYELLLEELMDLRKERPFKRRHIDLEAFQSVGPYIDWRNAVH